MPAVFAYLLVDDRRVSSMQALQQQLAQRNGAPYIPGASGPHDYDEAMGYAASRLHDDYIQYSDDDDNVVVVDPDNMYDDDGNIIDISKYERVKESDKPKPAGCKLGCDGDDEDEEEEPTALRDKTGSHGRLAIFQLYEVIFAIGNHPTGKTCIFSNSA